MWMTTQSQDSVNSLTSLTCILHSSSTCLLSHFNSRHIPPIFKPTKHKVTTIVLLKHWQRSSESYLILNPLKPLLFQLKCLLLELQELWRSMHQQNTIRMVFWVSSYKAYSKLYKFLLNQRQCNRRWLKNIKVYKPVLMLVFGPGMTTSNSPWVLSMEQWALYQQVRMLCIVIRIRP